MGFMAYAPLGRGILSGQFRKASELPEEDGRKSLPRYRDDNYDKNARLLAELGAIAREHDITLPRLAIAWVLHRGDDIIPIPSSKSLGHLEDNVAAIDVVPYGAAAGTRYPEKDMSRVNV
jgi:aryl-alcohol dehydrogenase-like predicted oxidoreductase